MLIGENSQKEEKIIGRVPEVWFWFIPCSTILFLLLLHSKQKQNHK